MIINADSLLPHLKEKLRPAQTDSSRHILCPHCGVRTKLNTLGDGRKKCTVCGKKFRVHKATDEKKLRQCAEILLSFCLDFSPLRTAQITHHRYRLVASYYDQFRKLLETEKQTSNASPEPSRCRWCNSAIRHGIRKRNVGFYLQESEWKFKNRSLHPHLLARKIITLMAGQTIS